MGCGGEGRGTIKPDSQFSGPGNWEDGGVIY